MTGERIVPKENRERKKGEGGKEEGREGERRKGFSFCQPSPMVRIGRYIQPATATCISISAELGAIDAGTIYRVVYRRAMAVINVNSRGISSPDPARDSILQDLDCPAGERREEKEKRDENARRSCTISHPLSELSFHIIKVRDSTRIRLHHAGLSLKPDRQKGDATAFNQKKKRRKFQSYRMTSQGSIDAGSLRLIDTCR